MSLDTLAALQLAREHHEAGRLPQAEQIYRQILAANPDQPQALHLLGVLAGQCGQHDQALALIGRSVAADPTSVEANFNFGIALAAHGSHAQAADAFRAAIGFMPGFAAAHANLGLALAKLGHVDEAIASYRTAIHFQPRYAEAHANLGAALLGQGWMGQEWLEQAVAACRRAIELRPDFVEAHNNLGNALKELGRYDEAIVSYNRAIELKPDLAEAHFNLAMSRLVQGDMARGWADYEWRFKCRELAANRRDFTQPQWDGHDLAGRRIVLHAEQGLGDTIQFIRYVPLVQARGGRVIVEAQGALTRLLGQTPGVEQWVPRGEPLPPFDVHCYLLNLPLALGTTLQTIPPPGAGAVLRAEADLAKRWRARLDTLGPGLKVGLAWAGRPDHTNDRNRSMPLALLAPLAPAPGSKLSHTRFVSLQKGPAAEQIRNPPPGLSLTDWTPELHDLADTAALIAGLDLVISVDTVVAHLAGAMGRPVWLLLPFVPDWRWLLERDDSPWYPTMRLFRQPALGDWGTPIARLARELASAPLK